MKVLALPLFLFHASVVMGDPTLPIHWGILPFVDAAWNANGTVFKEGNAEMSFVSFNSHPFTLRLADVGDGSFDEIAGFSSLSWIDSASAQDAAIRWKNVELDGSFTIYASTSLPITQWGDYNKASSEIQQTYFDYEYYEMLWSRHKFTMLVYDVTSKRAYRLSESEGGTVIPDSILASFEGEIVVDEYNPMDPGAAQEPFYLVANVPSQAVYIGAEIPQKCVWMADKGLAAADLAGYDEKAVALAMALDKVPAEVAGGVELKIGSISLDPQAGTATLAFQFTATDETGESAAVSSLRGGARLLLETASSLGDLGTENASKQEVSLSSSSVTIPTSGETFFARLVLDTP